jgi:hypothetical protein
MINREQFLLHKLAEEAVEVAQRAHKSISFGHDEVQDGQCLTNAERLRDEIADFITLMAMTMEETYHIAPYAPGEGRAASEAKRYKVNKYYEYSILLGRVE